MNNEIREMLEEMKSIIDTGKDINGIKVDGCGFHGRDLKLLYDYITNLQNENERLKEKLNCKEYFSSTMPEDTEFVILTKNNYDRQQKDIQLELIDYKSRVEKAVEYIKSLCYIESKNEWFTYGDDLSPEHIVNILQNGSEVDYE